MPLFSEKVNISYYFFGNWPDFDEELEKTRSRI